MLERQPSTRVHKFGGAALATGEAVLRACRILGEHGGQRPVVVVSAHQGVTTLLVESAREAAGGRPSAERVRIRHRGLLRELSLDPELADRWLRELDAVLSAIAARGALGAVELDHVLSFGERLSARIVAAALRAQGIGATPLDAFDLGLTTDGAFGRARPVAGVEAALRASLAEVSGIPVVTGFLAKDAQGRLTTLGRNGSDLSAAIVAEALGARELVLWKGVPGVLTADPHLVSGARTIAELSLDDAYQLGRAGAEVLHPDAIAPVRRAGVRVRLLDAARPEQPGTVLVDRPGSERPVAIAGRRALSRLVLEAPGAATPVGSLEQLCAGLAAAAVEPRLLLARPGRLELWIDEASAGPAAAALPGAVLEGGLSSVELVGGCAPAAAQRALELLSAAGIAPLRAVAGQGERSQAFLVARAERAAATRALHEALLARALDAA